MALTVKFFPTNFFGYLLPPPLILFFLYLSSLLQCFRVRIWAQIFRPDLGPVRLPPLLYLVAHLPINTFAKTFWILLCREVRAQKIIHDTLCFSASHGFIWHFLFLVFETLLCFLLCFINYLTQIAPFFFFSVFFLNISSLLPIRFTLRYLPPPLLYSEVLFLFLSFAKKRKEKKKIFIKNHKRYGKS